jgi:hypothetical protein
MVAYSIEEEERIRKRAEEIYQYHKDTETYLILDRDILRGRTAQDDWLEAEAEILAEIGKEKTRPNDWR